MIKALQSESAWMHGAKLPKFGAISSNENTEVCIVGAGITGLTAAYLLAKEGKRVLVLEDFEIASGETERTTAHLSNILGNRYTWLEGVHGKEGARLIAQSHGAAIDRMEKIIKEESIDCQFERLSGYLFLSPGESTDELQKELEALKRVKIEAAWVDQLSLSTYAAGPALHISRQGQFHILKYMAGLADAAVRAGAKIHTGTHVSKIEGGAECLVETSSGFRVTAKDVIIATNAPVRDNALIFSKQAAYRTFVIGAALPKGDCKKGLYWDTANPYHYVRLLEEPEGDLLIVGGEDCKTGQSNDAELRFARLEQWARARFPKMGELSYRWSGQVMESHDGIALIGKLPLGKDHLYIATGDSGNGITHGTIAGIVLTDLLCKRKNPWEELYKPSRTRLRSGKEFIKENANIAACLVGDYVKPGTKNVQLEPNSGTVIGHGPKKIALYCDAKGVNHQLSAVCPHKGCIVHWNSFEKSWDCPCHGSRFDPKGHVLNGPSISDLQPVKEK